MKFKEMSLRRKRGERVDRKFGLGDNSERGQLNNLKVGDTLSGRVISLVPHGAYIDVSCERDVLLHVRDMSDTEFVGRPDEVVTPGMDLDLWVKYAEDGKVGLTLIEGSTGSKDAQEDGIPLSDLTVDDELWGVVVKVTNFGAFVDCGLKEFGWLHFMDHPDSPVMQGSKPNEYIKVGERVRVWVKNIEEDKGRVGLRGYRGEGAVVLGWD